MNRRISVLLCVASFFSAAAMQAETVKTHHVREVSINGEAAQLGHLSGTQTLQLDVMLPVRDQAGLDNFLAEIRSLPIPNHFHFLTPAEFTEKFGPTQKDYDAVVQYVQAHGLTVVGGSRDGLDVQVKGPVSAIESAFHVSMMIFQHPTENRTFYGPDREPTTDLAFPLWHVSGLDNFSIPHPMVVNRLDYAKRHGISPDAVVSHATTGSGPGASFLGSDMRAAYYGATLLNGATQNLGLFEYVGTDLADLKTYYTNVKQTTHAKITILSTDGTATSCTAKQGCDDTEQTLDMTQALGMAPGLASLTMYVGSTDSAIISAMTTNSPLPTTIGCSWGWTPVDPTTLDPLFQKMSSQGQNFFVASGDSSTWTKSNFPWPAEDPNVVTVGGTDLVTASAGGAWKSETGWADSGGGVSPDKEPIPAYQQLTGVINSTNKGSTVYRNGPDVSANANFTFYVCADQTTCSQNVYGGTSFAAPMWAGYVALANEYLVHFGFSPLPFLNPSLYAFGTGSGYATDFHDITSGKSGSFTAVAGYDLVTGWGSPNGTGLINALIGIEK